MSYDIVLLHGHPETPVVWSLLVEALGRDDVHTPQLPGFGCPAPAGFGATKEEYVDWFLGEVESIVAASGPVDLVGHDWGGGIGMRAVSLRPELFRSWACDVLGLFHPDYVWHALAQIWQSPEGEAWFEESRARPIEEAVALWEMLGIPRVIGEPLALASDTELARCALALYRSAAQPEMARWGAELGPAATVPGLVLHAPNDPFAGGDALAGPVGAGLGAETAELTGQGHWWMASDPEGSARTLQAFWERVGS
ncbi:MAG: alpha/beta fold hydrolase [Ilumatobacteraceae bacterium]